MRFAAAAALLPFAFLGSGCDAVKGPEEVRACEAFIKERLRSPSTYKRAEANSYGAEPISKAEFLKMYVGDRPDDLAKLLKTRAEANRLAIKRVFVKYDADNAYGTPVRDLEMCEFLVVGGEIDGKGGLESRATSTASRLQLRQLTEQLDDPDLKAIAERHGESMADCCVRY
jgi:hypothetical protein